MVIMTQPSIHCRLGLRAGMFSARTMRPALVGWTPGSSPTSNDGCLYRVPRPVQAPRWRLRDCHSRMDSMGRCFDCALALGFLLGHSLQLDEASSDDPLGHVDVSFPVCGDAVGGIEYAVGEGWTDGGAESLHALAPAGSPASRPMRNSSRYCRLRGHNGECLERPH